MIPAEWQHVFINNRQDITGDSYTLLKLQQYMATEETLHCALNSESMLPT